MVPTESTPPNLCAATEAKPMDVTHPQDAQSGFPPNWHGVISASASNAFPCSSNSSTLSESARWALDNPCKSPDCSPGRAPSLECECHPYPRFGFSPEPDSVPPRFSRRLSSRRRDVPLAAIPRAPTFGRKENPPDRSNSACDVGFEVENPQSMAHVATELSLKEYVLLRASHTVLHTRRDGSRRSPACRHCESFQKP